MPRKDPETLAREIRTHGGIPARLELGELVRIATLAANSHNTQPWHFAGSEKCITIAPDLTRATPVVDPENRHLFASLGCAAENMAIAAGTAGMASEMFFNAGDGGAVCVALGSESAATAGGERELYDAIFSRQCTRTDYSGESVDAATISKLEKASAVDGVAVTMVTGREAIEPLIGMFTDAYARQLQDRAFKAELRAWLRFSKASAMATRDGLFSACSGNPTIPDWLGSIAFRYAVTVSSENEKLVGQLRSSAGLAVFTGDADDPAHSVLAGRSCQRFALAATAAGLKYAFLNQPVEVAEFTPAFADAIGQKGKRPNLIVRFGYGERMPDSLRRPVGDVIIDPGP